MKDEQTEALKQFNDMQAKIVAEYVKKSTISKLEKVKAELSELLESSVWQYDVRKIIDNNIAETKGE